MASDELLERLWAPYRIELQRDYVSLSELVRHVRRALPDDTPFEEVRAITFAILRGVAERGEAEFGLFRPKTSEWEPWPGSPDELVAKVEADWRAYGVDKVPLPGEILYLNA